MTPSPSGPLSIAEAGVLLEDGMPLAAMIGELPIEGFRYAGRVLTEEPPSADTGTQGTGDPVTGRLAFTESDVLRIQGEGDKAIHVVALDRNPSLPSPQVRPDAHLVVFRSHRASGGGWPPSFMLAVHELVNLLCNDRKPVLLDNEINGQMALGRRGLALGNGNVLGAGRTVTINPHQGQLWLGAHEIEGPSRAARLIRKAACDLQSHQPPGAIPEVAFRLKHAGELNHVFSARDLVYVGMDPKSLCATGLWTTEECVRLALRRRGGTALRDRMARGEFPPEVAEAMGDVWSVFEREYAGSGLRLLDVEGLMGEEMSLATRRSLWQGQLARFSSWVKKSPKRRHIAPVTIIFPRAHSGGEVVELRKLWEAFDPDRKTCFGVMVERRGACQDIRQIAGCCDHISIGLRDLTREETGLESATLDHSDWMRERGYRGGSPFSVVIPPVLDLVKGVLQEARAVNPSSRISVCGLQMEDMPSLRAVLETGLVNQIVIAPQRDQAIRTSLAILQHQARKGLLVCGP